MAVVSIVLPHFFSSVVLADAFPRNLVADAFITHEGEDIRATYTAQDRADAAQLDQLLILAVRARIKVGRNDYVNMAKHRFPRLYRKLAKIRAALDEHENALPAKVAKFINDRKDELKNWFTNGLFDFKAFLASVAMISRGIADMTGEERAALFDYLPHMKQLLKNVHFQKFVHGRGDPKTDLEFIFYN